MEWNSTVISRGGSKSQKLEDLALSELGETPEIKHEALNGLRHLISGEPLLDCPTDESFLLKFLRARKYNVERAFENIRNYFMCRRDMPEIFAGLSLDCIPFDTACRKHRLCTLSRNRDPQGRFVIMLCGGMWTKDICSLNDFLKVATVHLEHLLLEEEAQIKGIVAVFDLKGFGAHHLTQYTPSVVRKVVHMAQDCCPTQIKAIYIINNPSVFDVIFALIKVLLRAKLLHRTQLLGYDVEKMRQLLPLDLIPEADGGSFESYDYDKMKKDLQSRTQFLEEMHRRGYCKGANKAQPTPPATEEIESWEVTHM